MFSKKSCKNFISQFNPPSDFFLYMNRDKDMNELGMVIVSQVPKAFESVVISGNIEEGWGLNRLMSFSIPFGILSNK